MMREAKEGFQMLTSVSSQRHHAQRTERDQKKLSGSPECSNGWREYNLTLTMTGTTSPICNNSWIKG